MKALQHSFSIVTKWCALFVMSVFLNACDSGGDRFLDKNIAPDSHAKTVISTQLIIGGQTESIVLSSGQESSVVVKVTYEDGSFVYLDSSEVTFEYARDQDTEVTNAVDITDFSSDEPPFVIDGFVLKVPDHIVDEVIAVVAVYQNSYTTPVMVDVHNKAIEHLQLTPNEHLLVKGAKSLFHIDAFYDDGSSTRLASDMLSGEWQVSDNQVIQINDEEGWFEALSTGKTTITYELNGQFSNSVSVTVSGELVAAIDITPVQLEMAKGTTSEVFAIATLSDGSQLDITSSVSWSELSC